MRIAVPLTEGMLSAHFGHCEEFALVDVDERVNEVSNITRLKPPAHQPGVLPGWLADQEASVIIAGGMGQRAQQLFAQNGIAVLVGAPSHTPGKLANAYLLGTLAIGENIGILEHADSYVKITGPCGDTIEMWIVVEDGRISDIAFMADGCGATITCASYVTRAAKGKTIIEALRITPEDIVEYFDGLPDEHRHCAKLAVMTLRAAIEEYQRPPRQ